MFVTRGTESCSWVLPYGIPAEIPDFGGFRNKLFLPRNDLIPTCVPTESGNSAEFSRIPEKEARPEPEKKSECTTKVGMMSGDATGGTGVGWTEAPVDRM